MENNSVHRTSVEYRRKKSAKEMRNQFLTFILMIFFTVISFVSVAYNDLFPSNFVAPFILLLAGIQVIFQLYYFMHASHKGHEMPMFFMYSGVFAAFLTILAFLTIVWW
ncbi:cytochrome c oxidase subunit IVB [Fervidibacillus halotolerans]|uniref:Cytochrome c oxidase subunit IVB n=1 Tax=Fervidibacillus halotolerans TaxID=2980027 RepID=A0A9E8M2A1_9BACI|nr:cytochrome c oxidase subunit IVB [Fervidibacillus halotolerans]WAA13717.1 cytochrome c oxidase subunit IVB [Fervidibacillus halotolerans]